MQASDLFFSIKNFDQQKLKLISEELNINTINDFLEYFPYKYVSQIKIENTSDLNDKLLDNVIEIEGSIEGFYFIDTKSGKQHLEADFVFSSSLQPPLLSSSSSRPRLVNPPSSPRSRLGLVSSLHEPSIS